MYYKTVKLRELCDAQWGQQNEALKDSSDNLEALKDGNNNWKDFGSSP